MNKREFTETNVRALPIPPTEYYIVKDSETKGLGARVTKGGSICYIAEATLKLPSGEPKTIRRTIGSVFEVPLKEARERAVGIRWAASQGIDLEARAVKRAAEMTYAAWVEEYMASCRRTEARPDTKERHLKMAVSAFGDKPISAVTVGDIRAVINKEIDGVRSRAKKVEKFTGHSTGNMLLAMINASFEAAINNDLLEANPAKKIKPIPQNGPRQAVFTEEEFQMFRKALEAENPEDRRMFLLLFETGMRIGEVFAISWEDLDPERHILRLPPEKNKSRRPQAVPLSSNAIAILTEQKAAWPNAAPQSPIFPAVKDPTGTKHRTDASYQWHRILRKSGIQKHLVPHDIRRTVGLRVTDRHGILSASRLLRHSSVKITERVYAPHSIDDDHRFVENLW